MTTYAPVSLSKLAPVVWDKEALLNCEAIITNNPIDLIKSHKWDRAPFTLDWHSQKIREARAFTIAPLLKQLPTYAGKSRSYLEGYSAIDDLKKIPLGRLCAANHMFHYSSEKNSVGSSVCCEPHVSLFVGAMGFPVNRAADNEESGMVLKSHVGF